MATTLQIQSLDAPIQSGSKQIGPFNVVGTDTIDVITTVQLASGANTITVPQVPATVIGCVIVPYTTATASLTIKGISGDTGIRVSPNNPTVLTFDPAAIPASFVITAGAAYTSDNVMTISWF